jgi:hypothetical protein
VLGVTSTRIVTLCVLAALFVFSASSPVSGGDAPGIGINAQGTFTDLAAWIYKTPDGKFKNGPPMKGTNEILIPDPPKPETGGAVVGISHFHHPTDTQGYPLHISLYEKAFANANKVELYSTNESSLWKYEPGDPVYKEEMVTGSGGPDFKVVGPTDTGTIPPQYQAAFDFARNAVSALTNLPDPQKDMTHYNVLFAETTDRVWVEFGPVLAQNEIPHLGCQAQFGRDMVFGVLKKSPPNEPQSAAFIQCF